jgi:acyl carrier protein
MVKPAPEVATPQQAPNVTKTPVAATQKTVAADQPAVAPPTEEFQRDLVEAISQRTGYPKEMLKEDALLEADLGIDSIKTVEIFSSLTKYHQFLPGGGFEDEEESLSEFAQMKTLRDIINSYERKRNESLALPVKGGEAKAESGQRAGEGRTPAPAQPSEHQVPIQRLEVKVAAASPSEDGKKKTSRSTIRS